MGPRWWEKFSSATGETMIRTVLLACGTDFAATFGKANVFMDVDNLIAGQRFDEELAKALAQCDVLIAVVGARWMELLKARRTGGEFDYVREEIAEALSRKLVVIPVRVGREGSLPPVPRIDELPRNIREIVLHQKHDVTHERFGRDIADLIDAMLQSAERTDHRALRHAHRGVGFGSDRQRGRLRLRRGLLRGRAVAVAGSDDGNGAHRTSRACEDRL